MHLSLPVRFSQLNWVGMNRGEFSSFNSFFMEPIPELEPGDSSLFANISNVEQRYVFQDIGEWKKW